MKVVYIAEQMIEMRWNPIMAIFCCESLRNVTLQDGIMFSKDFVGLAFDNGRYRIDFCPFCGKKVEVSEK